MNKVRLLLVGFVLVVLVDGWPIQAGQAPPTARERAVLQLFQRRLTTIGRLPARQRAAAIDRLVHPGTCQEIRDYYRGLVKKIRLPLRLEVTEMPSDPWLPSVPVFSISIFTVNPPAPVDKPFVNYLGGLRYNQHPLPRGGLEIIPYQHDCQEHRRRGHHDEELMQYPHRNYFWDD